VRIIACGRVLIVTGLVSEVEFSWLEVAECGVQTDIVVLIDEQLYFPLSGEVVVSVVVLALVSHGADPALDDAVGLGVAGASADVHEVVSLDNGT